jgi:L-lactate dehydrogenase complex protein LldF
MVYSKLNAWGKARYLPEIKNENFDQWYKVKRKNNG